MTGPQAPPGRGPLVLRSGDRRLCTPLPATRRLAGKQAYGDDMQEIPLDISEAHAVGMAPAPGQVTLTPGQVAFLVETAGRAPSVHNTQPWQFRVRHNGLDLYADRDRRLRAIDPA